MPSSVTSPLHSSSSSSQPTTVPPLFTRKAMSITQTYYLAHTARGKLSHEAARPDHNLRFLVGHANLLDALMLELAEAEQEQESWFNQSVRGATKNDERHIQWADTLVDEPDDDWRAEDADSDSDSDSDSNSEYDEDELETCFASLQRVDSSRALPQSHPDKEEGEEEEDEEDYIYEDDGEEDYAMLVLSRTPSHPSSPPELSHDSEEDSSEDESMPPSPPSDALPSFGQKQRSSPNPKPSPSGQDAFFDESFYLPSRNAPSLVSSICVY